jgi:FtsP/CotA-like multicopper oxidase with cupredoxin domain
MLTRREALKLGAASGVGWYVSSGLGVRRRVFAAGGPLDPSSIPKYVTPLVIPPAMPRTRKIVTRSGKNIDYYEIAVRQFRQHILPSTLGLDPTTVWGYGSVNHPGTFNYPSFTIEAKWNAPVRVKWINDLVDGSGGYLPHLLPVDQTLHWANPPGGASGRDMRGTIAAPYQGPVPLVTHVHGAHTTDESDGYAEAWYLPAAGDIPGSYARVGTWHNFFRAKFAARWGVNWEPGTATFQYPNDQRAATLWYHDHVLGMTRLNVYAGPAGFYILRGGPDDEVRGKLPGPAPALGDEPALVYRDIPIAIQDRAFNSDGSLFYPNTRAYFEDLDDYPGGQPYLNIPYIPDTACGGPSDVSPIWNPEFFGDVMVVNGKSWPFLTVEDQRYRFRFLNGCNSRFLILKFDNNLPFWQIGTEGGFLSAPVLLHHLLLGPAERADVIVDFGEVPVGTAVTLLNLAPDEPFSGGAPGVDFAPADPATTGQVMQMRVIRGRGADRATHPVSLGLPARTPLPAASVTRQVSLNEAESSTVKVSDDGNGNLVLDCVAGEPFGPTEALLGTMAGAISQPREWEDAITENPECDATEIWEIFNFTADAHPIHVHEVAFEVVNREIIGTGEVRQPEPWETATKDTVIAYPGEITRIKALFDLPGQYVWHCHIVEHEDNEMMRPYSVGPPQTPTP